MGYNEIEKHLYLGDCYAAQDLNLLKSLNIKCLLSVWDGLLSQKDFESIIYKEIKAEDRPSTDLITHFPETNQFIDTAVRKEDNVLVHCRVGVSRSVTIVLAYLMNKYRMTFNDAFDFVKSRRPFIDPNEGFVAQLKVYEEMNFTFDANNRKFRRILIETNFISGLYWKPNRINDLEVLDIYFSKRDLCERLTQNLVLGNKYLCVVCGFKLFNSIHVLQNEIPKDQELNQKPFCKWTYIEPQKWMKGMDFINESMLRCPKCKTPLIEQKGLNFPSFQCDCVRHQSIHNCLGLRIDNQNFKIKFFQSY